MALEKVQAQIVVETVVDESSKSAAEREMKVFARDTKKELDKGFLLTLQIDKAKLALQLEETKKLLAQAKKDGDAKAALELTVKTDKLKSELTEAGRRLNNYQNTGDVSLSRLQAKFDSVNGNIKAQGGIIDGLKSKFLALGPIIAGAFSVSALTGFFKEIDDARRNLVRATGATGEALDTLQGNVRNVYAQVPESLDEISRVIGEVNTRFDLTGQALEDLTMAFIDFAGVTGGDSQEQVRTISRLTKDWGLDAAQTAGLLDVLTLAGQKTGVNVDSLATSLTNYGVQLRTLGFSLGESVALLSSFEKEWVNTEAILAGLNKGITDLAKQSGKTIPEAFDSFIKSIKDAKTEAEALVIANETLGAKAGPQLALAVREGRFEIGEFQKSLEGANGTLQQTAKDEEWATESLDIFIKRIKGAAIPAVQDFGNAIWWIGGKLFDFYDLAVAWIGTFALAVWTGLVAVTEAIRGGVNFIIKNLALIPYNFGVAFDRIAPAVKPALNRLVDLASQAVNGIIGFLNIIPGVNLWPVEFAGFGDSLAAEDFKFAEFDESFEITGKASAALGKGIDDLRSKFSKLSGDSSKAAAEVKNDVAWLFKASGGWAVTPDDIDKDKAKKNAAAKAKAEKEAQEAIRKAREQEQKNQIARDEVERGLLKKQDDRRQKSLELWKKGYEEVAKAYDSALKESEKRTEEFEKKIKSLRDEIGKLDEQLKALDSERATTLGARNVEIEKEIASIRAQSSITGEDIEKINALLEEQRLIAKNATQAEIDEAKRLASLSPTALFLEQYAEKKKALDEDRAAKALELAETQAKFDAEKAGYEALTNEKEALDERYRAKAEEIEAKITSNVFKESKKRIDALEAVRLKAIETAAALASAWVAPATAQASQTANTVNNSPTVIVNANVASTVDVNELGNRLADKIALSNKGIQ